MSVMSEAEYRENEFFRIFGSVPQPPFEDASEQLDGWCHSWGCSNDVGRLLAALMHRPAEELMISRSRARNDRDRRLRIARHRLRLDRQEPPDLALMQQAGRKPW